MPEKKKTFASVAKPVQPRGILQKHLDEEATPNPTPAPAKPKAKKGGGRPAKDDKERATVKQTLYFTPAEMEFIEAKRGLVKLAPHLRQALHEAGYFKGMKR